MGSAEGELLRNYLKLSRDELDSMNRGGNPNLTCNAQGLRAEQNGANMNQAKPEPSRKRRNLQLEKSAPKGTAKVSHKGGVVCQ
jgi:hypothetical protein